MSLTTTSTTGLTTDVGVIGGVRRGDPEAWCRFIGIYNPVVYRLAKKKGLDSHRADDLVQLFNLAMVKTMPTFEYRPDKGRFRKYVITVALNLIRRMGQREADYDEVIKGAIEEARAAVDQPLDLCEEDWFDPALQASLLQMALLELEKECSEKHRQHFEIFRLLAIEERSGDEVAKMFGMTRNQVYGIKFRKTRQLRDIAQRLWEQHVRDIA